MKYLANLILKKRYFIGALLGATLFMIYLPNIASLSLGEDKRIFLDLAIAVIYLFSAIPAAICGFSRPVKQALIQILLLNIFLFLFAFLTCWRTYGEFNLPLLLAETTILSESLIFLMIGFLFAKFAKGNINLLRKSLFALTITLFVLIFATAKYIANFRFGSHRAAADIIWLETVQYYGDLRKAPHPKTGRYLNLVSALDPYFCRPYSFGIISFFDKDELDPAIEFGKKGVANCPNDWTIPFFLGAAYNQNGDRTNAARYFDLAAENPSSPGQMKKSAENYHRNNSFDGNN